MTTYGSILYGDNGEEKKGEEDLLRLCSRRSRDLPSSSSSFVIGKSHEVAYNDDDCSRRGRQSQKSMVVSVAKFAVSVVVTIAAATILAAAIGVAPRLQQSSSNSVSDDAFVVERSRQEVLLPPHFLRTHPTAYYERENNMDQQDDRFFFYGDDDIKLMRDKPHHRKKKDNNNNKAEKTKASEESSSSSSSKIEDASPPDIATSAPSELSSDDDEEVEEDSPTTITATEETPPPAVVTKPTEFTPIAGFTADLLDYDSPSLLHWYCEPGKDVCSSSSGGGKNKNEEGTGSDDDLGYWGLVSSSRSDTPHYKLIFSPPPRHDFWRYTYYEPTLLKDDGSFLYTVVPKQPSMPTTVTTSFTLHNPNSQFDAAGIMIRLDSSHWIKTGIEVVDQQPRVSCVVTNTYSDWSTESYGPPIVGPTSESSGSTKTSVRLQLRVHMLPRHGGSFVVEIVPYDDTSSDEEESVGERNWTMIRMAHLNKAMVDPTVVDEKDADDDHEDVDTAYEGPAAPDESYMVGVYASSPVGTAQPPMVAVFHSFTVSEGSDFDQGGF